jgi:serine-type D-Ala-D-Ala carboxypeptidase/endopeptidase (penicillin-binding protein 4)
MRTRAFCAVALILTLAACEGSPTLPAGVRVSGTPSPPGSAPHCHRLARIRAHLESHPAPWKTNIERLANGYSVGIAVGVRGLALYEHDARRHRTPASNEKLMLSMALFDRLGPHYRIRTRAMARRVEGGEVSGNLWLVGAGDPTLTQKQPHYWGGALMSPTLEELAEKVRSAGIKTIAGGVRGSTAPFTHDFYAPGWKPYVPRSYVQLAAALSLNGNFHVKGRPERAAARAFSHQLGRRGIEIENPLGTGRAPAKLSPIAQVKSAPLTDVVAYMDQTSNNFFAETLGKLLGTKVFGSPGTIRKGARAIAAWTRRAGVSIGAEDSSGLSYRDKVSPLGLMRLLGTAERRPWGATLRQDLAAPGEGTLAGRLAGLDVHAKTGTLFNSDSALSGWVRRNADSPWVEFSILDQNMPKAVEDQIVKVIARAPIAAPAHSGLVRSACS